LFYFAKRMTGLSLVVFLSFFFFFFAELSGLLLFSKAREWIPFFLFSYSSVCCASPPIAPPSWKCQRKVRRIPPPQSSPHLHASGYANFVTTSSPPDTAPNTFSTEPPFFFLQLNFPRMSSRALRPPPLWCERPLTHPNLRCLPPPPQRIEALFLFPSTHKPHEADCHNERKRRFSRFFCILALPKPFFFPFIDADLAPPRDAQNRYAPPPNPFAPVSPGQIFFKLHFA